MRNAFRLVAALAVVAALDAATPWYVTNTGTDTPTCGTLESPCKTVQFTIDNRASAGDIIKISAGSFPSNLILRKSLVLQGSSSGTTFLDGGNSGPVAIVLPGQRVVFEFVTLLHGFTFGCGAGIRNLGTVALLQATVTLNTAYQIDLGPGQGGGICNNGSVSMVATTISNNTAAEAGGIMNVGNLAVSRSTISGNTSQSFGGGVESFGPFYVVDSTIANNTAIYGSGIYNVGDLVLASSTVSGNVTDGGIGGGIYSDSSGTVTMKNTIVSGNTAGFSSPDCSGVVSSLGYNLIGDASGCTITGGPGDLTDFPAGLGPLANNGGATQTFSLTPGSAAIDAGDPAGCTSPAGQPLSVDQRGAPRTSGSRCDIGSYELSQ
jgi:hypothetical protein